jgi:hypothetical protein
MDKRFRRVEQVKSDARRCLKASAPRIACRHWSLSCRTRCSHQCEFLAHRFCTILTRHAKIAACVRSSKYNLHRTLHAWLFTVFGLISNCLAISLLLYSAAMRCKASNPRSLRFATGAWGTYVLQLLNDPRRHLRMHHCFSLSRFAHRAPKFVGLHVFEHVGALASRDCSPWYARSSS